MLITQKDEKMTSNFSKKIIIAILVIAFFASFIPIGKAVTVLANPKSVIVLDAGHGGYDGGVVGLSSGVKESAINLEIVKLVKGYLESDGYKVVLTRSKDEALGDTKQEDMKKRIEIIKASACSLLVSVHVNFYPSKYRRGIQTFFNKSIDEDFAKSLQATLNSALNVPTLNRNFASLWGDYYILANAPCPATIIETGFVSNSEDEAQLLSAEYRMILAYHIFCGIRNYLNEN